jgi:predicted DsbA family dithiol-disulfide isomerase
VTFKGTYREAAWHRAASMSASDGITYTMWARNDYAAWSLPALEAAKCVASQGNEAFERVHLLLFEAFFAKGINIGNRDEVIEVIRGVGVDMERFLQEYDAGTARAKVLTEYEEARSKYQITFIPTVIFDGGQRVVGATSLEDYLQVLAGLGLS